MSKWGSRLVAPPICAVFALGTATASAARWQVVRMPMPPGASSASFDAVACVHASSCWAVGLMKIGHHRDRATAERWNGRRWSAEAVPSPKALGQTELTGIACTGVSACVAVGVRGAGEGGTLVERWGGRKWAIQGAPSPAGSSLNGVSCSSASDCLAVGNSGAFDSSGIFNYSLNLHWNGSSWIAAPYSQTGFLNSVSCPSAVFCAAVGDLADSAGFQSVAERWNGTSSSDVTSGDGNSSEPQSVSCVSSRFCMAVGTAEGDVVSRWNGHRWKFARSPTGLDTVWCLSSRLCVAAGAREVNEERSFARVERWNGSHWSTQALPAADGTVINGVTCTGASTCTAVGSAGSDPLAVRYGGNPSQ